jgi:dolichol-phosphate mannosyltransferase
MQKRIIVIPTYNEVNNLPVMAAEIWALKINDLAILVVDDNSPDGTGDVAEELAQQRPEGFFVLHQPARLGLGRAYVAGFKWALAKGADLVIQMDCDFSHSPLYIPEIIEEIEKADVVVGSRYMPGGQLDERWGTARYLLSWWANSVYTRLILNLKVKDTTSGFKCWRANALNAIDLDAVKSNGYSFQFEMAYLAERMRYRIIEIPIRFEDRRIGRSKMTLPRKLEAVFRAWEIPWRYRNLEPPRRQPRPRDQRGKSR